MNETPKKKEVYLRGQKRILRRNGETVTILGPVGDAFKVINENGKIELVYPSQLDRTIIE